MIRRAQEKDISQINVLLKQVLDIHHEGRSDIFKADVKKYTDQQLIEIIKDDNRPIFVYEENDEIIGYAFCIFQQQTDSNILTDIKTLYIDDLVVKEGCRGKGTGKQLYDYVVEFAKASGCYNITLNVWSFNQKAREFYDHMGMKPQKTYMEHIIKQ